jgi:hypothetical protein
MLVLFAVTLPTFLARAEMPPNVKCAIQAQEKARNGGSEYKEIYKRNFERCMLNAMPRERQITHLMERLKPYEAVSPRPQLQNVTQEQPKSTGTWVRLSPNVWILQPN